MDQETKRVILDTMQHRNILTLATIRENDWPQATTVGFGNTELVEV